MNDPHVWVLGSGRIGHEINARGVVEALGWPWEMQAVAPRPLYARLAPWGPVEPRDPLLQRPIPQVVVASGRVTVPYARALKRAGAFVVFLQDPRWARREMDLIWVPEHDSLRGPHVIATLTSPHPFSPARLAAARAAPDPRLAALPRPICAVALGGPGGGQRFRAADVARLAQAIHAIRAQGFAVAATPSRRTPPDMAAAVRAAVGDGFFWDGTGENPYPAMLALADALLVTGDSANMVGEAVATGAPVHVFSTQGGRPGKLSRFLDALVARGAARRWAGRIEAFTYAPLDSSAEIAREIKRRYALHEVAAKPQRV